MPGARAPSRRPGCHRPGRSGRRRRPRRGSGARGSRRRRSRPAGAPPRPRGLDLRAGGQGLGQGRRDVDRHAHPAFSIGAKCAPQSGSSSARIRSLRSFSAREGTRAPRAARPAAAPARPAAARTRSRALLSTRGPGVLELLLCQLHRLLPHGHRAARGDQPPVGALHLGDGREHLPAQAETARSRSVAATRMRTGPGPPRGPGAAAAGAPPPAGSRRPATGDRRSRSSRWPASGPDGHRAAAGQELHQRGPRLGHLVGGGERPGGAPENEELTGGVVRFQPALSPSKGS